MSKKFTIDDLISELKSTPILEATETKTAEDTVVSDTPKSAETYADLGLTEQDLQKIAQLREEEGRIMARSFLEELNKQAMNMHLPLTPDTMPMLQMNPQAQVSVGHEVRADQTDKVLAILNSLRTDFTTPVAKIDVNAPAQTGAPAQPMTSAPTGAEVARAERAAAVSKTSSEDVVNVLYSRIFKGE